MCCDQKCFFFIKVRTGSLIFGYINAVLTGLGVLGILCGLIITLTVSFVYPNNYNYDNNQQSFATRDTTRDLLWTFNYLKICFIQVAVSFVCTVLLLFGITENKPALVKAYVIYGMLQLMVLIAVMITLFAVSVPPVFAILVFLGCCIYLMIIYMVYLTHKGMINPERQTFSNPPNIVTV